MASFGGRGRILAVVLLFVGAVLHAVAAFEPEHMEKQLFFTAFWAMVASQALAGLLVLRNIPYGAAFGLVVNLGLVALFIATRFIPVPGEEMAEPVEAFGVVTTLVEIAAVPFLLGLVRPSEKGMGTKTRAESA